MSAPKQPVAGPFPLFDPSQTYRHPHLDDALDRIRLFRTTPDDSAFAALIGPTAAGKTHVSTELQRTILKESVEEMRKDQQYLPVVYYRIKLLTRQPIFNWTNFFTGLLTAAQHPNPTSKNLGDAWDKWRRTLQSRRIKLVIIDEGAHFVSGIKPEDRDALKAQADVIKSLVDDSSAKLVIAGSYDLEPLLTTNAQLIRRNQRVHLRRYRNSPEDRQSFLEMLEQMDRDFHGYFDCSLAENEAALYEGSLGLWGMLRNWLVSSATLAGKSKITLEHIGDCQRDANELLAIHQDVRFNEKKFYDTTKDWEDIADRLKHEADEIATTESSASNESSPRKRQRPKAKK